MLSKRVNFLTTSLSLIILLAANLSAIPPSPEAIEQWRADGTLEQNLIKWREVDRIDSHLSAKDSFDGDKFRARTALAGVVDTVYVVVALVDFSDNESSEEDWEFDSLLFSVRGEGGYNNPTGSWTDFYLENSYGKFFVKGIVSGWHRMPNPYSYYVGDDPDDTGVRSNILAKDAALATDGNVDYSDLVESGSFLGFVVVHAGPGAEAMTPPGGHIWSHKGGFSTNVVLDGIHLSGYTMNPEKYGGQISTMGVFAHEYGHTLGLPDLYDTDYLPSGSSGLGRWSMMAGGSWNGLARGGDTPSHFDAWCKWVLRFVTVKTLRWNNPDTTSPPTSIIQAEIPQVESEPVVYKIWNDGNDTWGEFWLVENRQKVGFDAALPGHGLCIYHVDTWEPTNNPGPSGYYKVALEQADGLDALRYGGPGSSGDAGDPFPGTTNNRNFHDVTTPNSRTHLDQQSQIGVWNISDSDSLMFADLEAGFTHPWPVFYEIDPIQFSDVNGGNGNGVLEPGETIEFKCRLVNTMALSFDPWVNLTVDHPDITFSVPWATLGNSQVFNPIRDYWENDQPLTFEIPEDFDPANVTFTLKLVSDNICCGESESHYTTTWDIEQVLGQPKIMLVDNDGGQNWDLAYRSAINDLGHAWGRWDQSTQGAPTADDLTPYEIVMYMSGHPATGGTFNSDNAAAFAGYLEARGHLAIVSATAATQINSTSPTFLPNYMHADYDGTGAFGLGCDGIDGSGLGDGLSFIYDGRHSFPGSHDKLLPIEPTVATFNLSFYGTPVGVGGTAYSGPVYKAIMLTSPLEFYDNNYAGYNTSTDLMAAIIYYFDGIATDVAGDDGRLLPNQFGLAQNYPNPFNPSTTISYTVPSGETGQLVDVRLDIFNVLGQTVETLVNKPHLPGSYTVSWDGRDSGGGRMASGVYLYRLSTGAKTETKKMILVK